MRTFRQTVHMVLAGLLVLLWTMGSSIPSASAAPTPQSTAVDLMLVIDGSASIGAPDFELARTFAKQVAASCVLGIDARVGAVQFSDQGATQLISGLTGDANAVVAALNRMRQIDGNTDIQEGLERAQQQIDANGRKNAKHFIVLLTDGDQTQPGDAEAQAASAKQAGTSIFSVGVGSGIVRSVLSAIASDPDSTYLYTVNQFSGLASVLTALLGTSCPGAPVLPPTHPVIVGAAADRDTKPAEISVVARPSVNISVPRGRIVTYTVVVANRGKGPAQNVRITLPFNPATTSVLDVQTSRPAFYVSAVHEDSLIMQTGRLGTRSDVVTATVRLQTQAGAPDDSLVSERLTYRVTDNTGGDSGRSNAPILSIGASEVNEQNYTLTVSPTAGPAGSTHTFSSGIFAPDEPVALWYNTPDGQVKSVGVVRADSEGTISVEFTTGKLAPGSYTMVARGEYTQFTAVGTFRVE